MVIVIPGEDSGSNGFVQVFLNQGTDVGGTWLGLVANDPIEVGTEPSSVDVGFLGAAHFFAQLSGMDAGVRGGLRLDETMTTLPSYFMLRGAMEGFLPEPLSDLLRAVASGSRGRLTDAVWRLAGFFQVF